jgi:hypothetical protein
VFAFRFIIFLVKDKKYSINHVVHIFWNVNNNNNNELKNNKNERTLIIFISLFFFFFIFLLSLLK